MKGVSTLTKKRINLIILIVILSIFLVGCSSVHFRTFTGEEDNKAPVTQQTQENEKQTDTQVNKKDENDKKDTTSYSSDNKSDASIKDEGKTETTVTIQPVQTKELKIYSIDNNNYELVDATALIPMDSKITPEFIVKTVVNTLRDLSLEVGYHSVSTKDDIVIVDFRSDMSPVYNVGAGVEAAILDAIAQSLLDNLNDYKKVIYRVDGKAYVTGHIELGLDEIYLEE